MSRVRSTPGWTKEKEKPTPGCAGCLCKSEHVVLVGNHDTQARVGNTAADQTNQYFCLTNGIITSQSGTADSVYHVAAGMYEIAGTKLLLHVPGMFYIICLLP